MRTITSKKPLSGNKRSHSCKASKCFRKPNLQKVTLYNCETVRMSARELRTLKKAA